jgi:hypothetical protein
LGKIFYRYVDVPRMARYKPGPITSQCRTEKTRRDRTKKGRDLPIEAFCDFYPGGDLRSHTVTRAVSSAQRGLTSVFGMGTGVTLAV